MERGGKYEKIGTLMRCFAIADRPLSLLTLASTSFADVSSAVKRLGNDAACGIFPLPIA